MGPLSGRSGTSAFSMTVLPFNITVTRLPMTVMSNEFHWPTGLSAGTFGTAAARCSGVRLLSFRTDHISPEPMGQHQMLTCPRPVPRSRMPESAFGVGTSITVPSASVL